ncbi:hypothetical protein [Nocardia sp. NPDC050413]|uniref:hypothetical protein n=1 Tax=Nocardia sp. NPDC050413 TaxID=3155784 RepID=UPI0033C034DF
MSNQGEPTPGHAAAIAAILTVVVAGCCGVFVLLSALLLTDYEQGLGDTSGAAVAVAVVIEVPILVWLAGAILLMFRRRLGRWIVGIGAGAGLLATVSTAVTVDPESRPWVAAAIVIFGLILGLTVSNSTGRWVAHPALPRLGSKPR